MKYTKKRMVKTIMTDSAELFDLMFNNFMESMTKNEINYDLQFNNSMGKLCCQIIYERSVPVPENIGELAQLSGREMHCSDCPYFIHELDQHDGRRKYYHCSKDNSAAFKSRSACDWFYETYQEKLLDTLLIDER